MLDRRNFLSSIQAQLAVLSQPDTDLRVVVETGLTAEAAQHLETLRPLLGNPSLEQLVTAITPLALETFNALTAELMVRGMSFDDAAEAVLSGSGSV